MAWVQVSSEKAGSFQPWGALRVAFQSSPLRMRVDGAVGHFKVEAGAHGGGRC